MPLERRRSPLVLHGKYALRQADVARETARLAFNDWARGLPIEQIAAKNKVSVAQARATVMRYVRILHNSYYKWKLAEAKCHALGMELRRLRLGKDAAPDQPLAALDPPKCWANAFRIAGIDTVNQLRAVDSELLLSRWRFPAGAIDWAILKLNKMGLSHALRRPERTRIVRRPGLGRIER